MKLFEVSIMDDCESCSEIRVGNSAEEVEQKIWNEDNYSCLMFVSARELTEIDGYKVVFKKGKKIALEGSEENNE